MMENEYDDASFVQNHNVVAVHSTMYIETCMTAEKVSKLSIQGTNNSRVDHSSEDK